MRGHIPKQSFQSLVYSGGHMPEHMVFSSLDVNIIGAGALGVMTNRGGRHSKLQAGNPAVRAYPENTPNHKQKLNAQSSSQMCPRAYPEGTPPQDLL